jgi:hypothetical protein
MNKIDTTKITCNFLIRKVLFMVAILTTVSD